MKTIKLFIRMWLFTITVICSYNTVIQAQNTCNGENILAGRTFTPNEVIYRPFWNPSTNYTFSLIDEKINIQLMDPTYNTWQAQFFLDIDPIVPLNPDTEYCISFDIETNVPLPQVRIKFIGSGNHDQFIELATGAIGIGKQTISGTAFARLFYARNIDKVFFDFGGNPENTEIVVSNIAIHHITSVQKASVEYISIENITLFPNPVKDVLYIHGLESNTHIRIVDITGSVRIDQMIYDEINISQLTEGIYFVVIGDRTFKIVKQ